MNFIQNESAQKLRGGFYTDPLIAKFLSQWVLGVKPKSLLEPSCGDGAFIRSVIQASKKPIKKIFACEIDAHEAEKARSSIAPCHRKNVDIRCTDFLNWFVSHSEETETFDAVLGNPPFIRYQYLPDTQQTLSEEIFKRFNLPFTKHTNAWVPFVIASLSLLSPGGRLGMVIPSEIFHIPHSQSLRRFLASQCSKILIFDPEELWFDGLLQGVVLILAEKKRIESQRSQGVAVVPTKTREILNENAEKYFQQADYINGDSIQGKWMQLFLNKTERSLLADLKAHKQCVKFGEIADVDVGIVTGANKFFLVPEAVVKSYSLKRWAYPMFGRSEHVTGVIYGLRDHKTNIRAGLPANFIWFHRTSFKSLPPRVREYLRKGEEEGLPRRYKCRVRTPWYTVPSVYASPIAMLKRAHNYPRLVLNRMGAFTTDTAYRIRPKKISNKDLVYSFINSLTCLCAELEGRHYGGGVLELVPSEIERLLIPIGTAEAHKKLSRLDEDFRKQEAPERILIKQDEQLLGPLGLAKSDMSTLHAAWQKMKNRRHRTSSQTSPT